MNKALRAFLLANLVVGVVGIVAWTIATRPPLVLLILFITCAIIGSVGL